MSEVDYGMFSDYGNDAVDAIVRCARILNMPWVKVDAMLCDLAESRDEFAEATDTVVRENVYIALGY